MLSELVSLADRLEEADELIPLGYRDFSSPIDWILDTSTDPPTVREANLTEPRPNRKRTSAIRPLLLADYAYYVLGLAEEGTEKRAEKAHASFKELITEAAEQTGSKKLQNAAEILAKGHIELPASMEPRDTVAVGAGPGQPLFSQPAARRFWQGYVAEEFLSDRSGTCSVCGKEQKLLRTLPEDVALLGETCQITSFNVSAFRSHGLDQTLNASLCYACGAKSAQALNHLTKSDDHGFRVAEDQLAVFWTTIDEIQTEEGQTVDLDAMLATSLAGDPRNEEAGGRPTLEQVYELLRTPWTGREPSLRVGEGVHIAVLSPNKARLVIRDWIQTAPDELRRNLGAFMDAHRMESPTGEPPRSFGLSELLEPLSVQTLNADRGTVTSRTDVEPNLVRGLLRTAYQGHPPPSQLEARVVQKLQNPKFWRVPWLTHRTLALLALSRTWRTAEVPATKEVRHMPQQKLETLNTENPTPGYLCGRLLAVLEDAQRQAQGWDLNTTIVDRNFTAAATTPKSTLTRLLQLAEKAHLPKVRKERGTDRWLREEIEDILAAVDGRDGLPKTLDTSGQGDFALGFYHQRAAIRRSRRQAREKKKTNAEEENP